MNYLNRNSFFLPKIQPVVLVRFHIIKSSPITVITTNKVNFALNDLKKHLVFGLSDSLIANLLNSLELIILNPTTYFKMCSY